MCNEIYSELRDGGAFNESREGAHAMFPFYRTTTPKPPTQTRWMALFLITLAELCALSLWFSASAVVPQLEQVWHVGTNYGAWITAVVQIGFVVGAATSTIFSMADRFNSRHLFSISAVLGSILNLLFVLNDNLVLALLLRFLVGVTLAGVYPVAVKLLSQWFPTKRGLSLGVLIGGLTLGSALPHFVVSISHAFLWQTIMLVSSALALVSAGMMLWLVHDAPNTDTRGSTVSISKFSLVLKNRRVMLANYGYFGHMWELYAMWTWLPAFLTASIATRIHDTSVPQLSARLAFIAIGLAGAAGCVLGGVVADRIGRARLAGIAMMVSGVCSLTIGFTFSHAVFLTMLVALIWGFFVIADSAQFSAAVTEHAESSYIGTALTFQMAVGFLITVLSINLIPLFQTMLGWRYVFTILSIGPIVGVFSMVRLNRLSRSTHL